MIEANEWVMTAIRHAKEIYFPDLIRESGIPRARWETVVGPKPWLKSERAENRAAVDQLIRQSSDLMGIEMVDISANVIAAYCVIFVSPTNWLKVAMMYESARRAETLANDEAGNFAAGMTATQIHSLMWLYATGTQTLEVDEFRKNIIETAFPSKSGKKSGS